MKAAGLHGEAVSRIAPRLWLLAALLVLHAAAALPDRATFSQLDPILSPAGTLTADERLNPPSIQPRGPVPAIFKEARVLVSEPTWARDRDAPGALPASPTSLAFPVPGESRRPVVGDLDSSILPRNFDARGPPSLT